MTKRNPNLFSFSAKHFLPFMLMGCLSLILVNPLWASPEVRSQDNRFIDHGDLTISDTKTGLMWQKQDSFLHTGHWLHWLDAFNYVKELNASGYGGYHDWQLPTLDELRSLFEPEKNNSKQVGREMMIHMDPIFAQNGGGSHWSAETNGHFSGLGIIFNDGKMFSAPKKSKSRKSVRAVRYPSSQ